jgi:hypothetical protein
MTNPAPGCFEPPPEDDRAMQVWSRIVFLLMILGAFAGSAVITAYALGLVQ